MAEETPNFPWTVPEELGIPPDKLRARLDFFHQAVVLSIYDADVVTTRVVSAMDVAHALANDLAFGTGLLPPSTLWWSNSRSGPVYAIYAEPKIRKVALELDVKTPAKRFTLPFPGLIFLCSPGRAPYVFAVKKMPTEGGESDAVYNAPLCNIHDSGQSCAGTHRYPARVADIPRSFFTSFFTATAGLRNRSKLYPENIVHLWDYLDGKKRFPVTDLIKVGTIKDLMDMEMR